MRDMGNSMLDPSRRSFLSAAGCSAAGQLDTDFWMSWLPSTPIKELSSKVAQLIDETVADPGLNIKANVRYLRQALLDGYTGALIQPAYARLFKGLSESQLDQTLQSFAFKNCRITERLIGEKTHG